MKHAMSHRSRAARLAAWLAAPALAMAPVSCGDGYVPEAMSGEERVLDLSEHDVRVILHGDASYEVMTTDGRVSERLPQRHRIELRYASFDPLAPAQAVSVPPALAADEASAATYIVQFHTQALPAYQQRLANLGVQVLGALPQQAVIVRAPGAARAVLGQLPFVRWVGPFHPAFKLEQGLEAIAATADPQRIRYSILVHQRGLQHAVARRIQALGGEVHAVSSGLLVEATLDGHALQQVARLDDVAYIDRWTPFEHDMNVTRAISGADYVESVAGYTGQGVRAEVCDDGVRITHQDFRANPPILHPANNADNNHGTQVFGIVFGNGASDSKARGLLPNAEQPIFASNYSLTDRYAHTARLVDPSGSYRAVFQTSSWGGTLTRSYTTVSAEMDRILFDHDIVFCQSQSNAGTQDSRPQAWAKNVVSVGGIHNAGDDLVRSGDYHQSASTGPAADGRIKPDLSAQYGGVWTSSYTGDTAHVDFGGTSGATPIVCGYFGLLFQMWADGVFAGAPGQKREVFASRPHMTTAKALMIHGAYQYPFSGATHDLTRVHQGWGWPDVKQMYDVAKVNNWRLPILIDETDVIRPAEIRTYTMPMGGGTPLKVTMVYADPPANPSATVHRINDLSLRVTSPTGTVYWGNNGLNAGNWSAAGGVANTVDTVENVFVENAAAGAWTIDVIGTEITVDAHVESPEIDADYALVASRGNAGSPDATPPAAPSGLTATGGEKTVYLDWVDNTEPDVARYRVKRSSTAGGPYDLVGAGTVQSLYSDTSVSGGTTYYYVVTAVDAAGNESPVSNEAAATPYDNPPAAPAGLTATAGEGAIALDWSDNAEVDLAYYALERATSAGGPYTLVASGLTVSAYTDAGLGAGTTYYYVVTAVDTTNNVSDRSSEAAATPYDNPPAAPRGLTATGATNLVVLDWADNAEPDLASYTLKRSTTAGGPYSVLASGLTASGYQDGAVTAGTTYYYVVAALDLSGQASADSFEASATPVSTPEVLSSADFEAGLGDWSNVTGDKTDWLRDSGGTPSASTGPSVDHTRGTSAGFYVYMETSAGYANAAGNEAILQSKAFDGGTYKLTLSFFYHMYGANMGTLSVDVFDGVWKRDVWSIRGQQQASSPAPYAQATIDLSAYSGQVTIRLRGTAAGGYRGDMAVDDIKVVAVRRPSPAAARPAVLGAQGVETGRGALPAAKGGVID